MTTDQLEALHAWLRERDASLARQVGPIGEWLATFRDPKVVQGVTCTGLGHGMALDDSMRKLGMQRAGCAAEIDRLLGQLHTFDLIAPATFEPTSYSFFVTKGERRICSRARTLESSHGHRHWWWGQGLDLWALPELVRTLINPR